MIFWEYEYDYQYVKTDRTRMLLLNDCSMISSGHFFAICMSIFHKPESQTVILVYSTDLNPNLLKSYDTKSKYFHFLFFCNFVKKGSIGFFEFCFFFAFCVITLVLIKI